METNHTHKWTEAIIRSNAAWSNAEYVGAHYNWATQRYEITVANHIVATCRTVKEVKTFCAMHNAGLMAAQAI